MLRYTIATGSNDTNILTEYGVHVSGSSGLVGRPELKVPSKKYEWDYLNGEFIDMRFRRYKAREITLSCWISASSEINAVKQMNDFMRVFNSSTLIRLMVEFLPVGDTVIVGPPEALLFLVYLSSQVRSKYKWKKGKQVIEFDITLTEPSPVKRVYILKSTDVGNVTVSYSSTSEFDIHWGDGTASLDNIGDGMSVSHNYTTTGRHYIIVTGVIEDITAMTFTCDSEISITLMYEEI